MPLNSPLTSTSSNDLNSRSTRSWLRGSPAWRFRGLRRSTRTPSLSRCSFSSSSITTLRSSTSHSLRYGSTLDRGRLSSSSKALLLSYFIDCIVLNWPLELGNNIKRETIIAISGPIPRLQRPNLPILGETVKIYSWKRQYISSNSH